MNKSELDFVLRAVGRYVRKLTGGIGDEIRSLRDRLEKITDGSAIQTAVEAHVRQFPPSPGAKGDRGDPGPRGEPGPPGADAVVDHDQVVDALKGIHEEFVARFQLDLERKAIEFERRCMESVQKAVSAIPPPKEGPPGPKGDPGASIKGEKGDPGPAGNDGLSVENLTREYDPATHEIVETWRVPGSEVVKSLRYTAGGIRPAGYWKERTAAKSGEAWTHEGTLWIAVRDTSDRPSTESKDWVIGARKGRDGTSKPVKL